MPLPELLSNFKALARGDSSRTQACLDGLDAAFGVQDGRMADALHLEVARAADATLTTTFDAMADLVFTHGTLAEQPHSAGWQVLMLVFALERPAEFMPLTAQGTRMLQAELAERLGKPSEDVFVEPTLLSTDALFDYSVSEVQKLCGLTRLQAAGSIESDSLERGANAWMPLDGEPATDEGPERVEDEVALLVAVRDDDDGAARLAHLLTQQDRPLRTTFTLLCEQGDPVLLHARLLDAGAPWSVSTTALHRLPVERTLAALDVLEQAGLHPSRLVAALVEEEDEHAHTVRLSVLGAGGELLAGLLSYDLHEPECFLQRLALALDRVHGPQLAQLPQAYFDVEADDPVDGSVRFFVPGQGWRHAERLVQG